MARSRGGCLNCKARKRKCDQARPECQACSQRGMRCQGYSTPLRWVNGVASRGRFAGASIPDASFVQPETQPNTLTLPPIQYTPELSEAGSLSAHDPSSTESSSAFSPGAGGSDPIFQRCTFTPHLTSGISLTNYSSPSSWA